VRISPALLQNLRQNPFYFILLTSLLSVAAGSAYIQEAVPAPQEQTRVPDVPYVPTPQEVVDAMLRIAEVKPGDVLYDLGCGDGRIVVTAAKQFGAQATGVDINPRRISEAEANARAAGVTDRVRFLQQDLFETDIRDATVVTLFLLPSVNLRLRPTLLRDLKPGARIVSHAFDMSEWRPDRVTMVNGYKVYYWVVPAQVAGSWVWKQQDAVDAQPYRLQLTQEFQKISGTLRIGGSETPLEDMELVGDQLRFTVASGVQGQIPRMTFTGRINGDTITGYIETPRGATRGRQEWLARRVSPIGSP
jgi:precorrin-6B methylase 2